MPNANLRSIPTGVLVVGHGTRDIRGRDEFTRLVELVGSRMHDCVVQPCFLELAEPTIAAGLNEMADRQVRQVIVFPTLLFAAGHAKRDIPAAVEEARRIHDFETVTQADVLGLHDHLLRLSADRYKESLADRIPIARERTLLLMVGRGSLDPHAIATMHRFADLRSKESGPGCCRTAFFAMASPSLDESMEEAVTLPVERVVVQPHLLFEGQILQQVRIKVAEMNRAVDHQEWIVTDHLGPDSGLADAIVERCLQAVAAQVVSSTQSDDLHSSA